MRIVLMIVIGLLLALAGGCRGGSDEPPSLRIAIAEAEPVGGDLVVTFTILNEGQRTATVDPRWDFGLRSQGQIINVDPEFMGPDDAAVKSIRPGKMREFVLSYSVPSGTPDIAIEFKPGLSEALSDSEKLLTVLDAESWDELAVFRSWPSVVIPLHMDAP